jgi:hypothetical protein
MYNIPILPPRPSPFQQLTGGFTQGLGIANKLQQMAQQRRAQQFAEQMQPLQMQHLQSQIEQARQMDPLRRQQLMAQIESIKSEAALRRRQQELLGQKGGVQYGLGPTGLPFAVPQQATSYGANPVDPNNTSLSKQPVTQDQSAPGAQTSYIPSQVGATKSGASTWYNQYTGESISALTPQGRSQLQQQLQAYKRIKSILPDLKKYGMAGTGGAPLPPSVMHPLSFVDQFNNPDAAPFYSMNLNTGKESLLSARNLPRSNEGLHTSEGIIGRLPGEKSETYGKRLDKFENDEVDKSIAEIEEKLRIGGTRVPAPQKKASQMQSQMAVGKKRNISELSTEELRRLYQ